MSDEATLQVILGHVLDLKDGQARVISHQEHQNGRITKAEAAIEELSVRMGNQINYCMGVQKAKEINAAEDRGEKEAYANIGMFLFDRKRGLIPIVLIIGAAIGTFLGYDISSGWPFFGAIRDWMVL